MLKNKLTKPDVFLKFKKDSNQFLITTSNILLIPLAANAPNSIPKIKKDNSDKKNLYLPKFSICSPNLKAFLSAIICKTHLSFHIKNMRQALQILQNQRNHNI